MKKKIYLIEYVLVGKSIRTENSSIVVAYYPTQALKLLEIYLKENTTILTVEDDEYIITEQSFDEIGVPLTISSSL